MPEGDTVWHTATILRDALAGKTLTRCDVRVPKFATMDLTGQVVDEGVAVVRALEAMQRSIRGGGREEQLEPC